MSEFYEELTKMLSFYQRFQNGDFNFHMNKPERDDVKKLTEIFDTFDKSNIIKEPTHEQGNNRKKLYAQKS